MSTQGCKSFRCVLMWNTKRTKCLIMCRPMFDALQALYLFVVFFLFVFNLRYLFLGVFVCAMQKERFIMCCLVFDVMEGILGLSLILLLSLPFSFCHSISLFLSLTCSFLPSPLLPFSCYSLSSSPNTSLSWSISLAFALSLSFSVSSEA